MVSGPLIQIIQRSGNVTTDELQAAAEAVQRQAREHLAPEWGVGEGCTIEVVSARQRPRADAWWMVVVDTPDVADALAYHDVTPEGKPVGKVFMQPLIERGGLPVSGSISHEVLEALVDPRCNEWSFDERGAFYATEVCDAVQGIDYQIDGITVANFVLPSFFHRLDVTSPYDKMGAVAGSFQTLANGYQLKWTRSRGMHQVFGSPRALSDPSTWRRPKPPVGSRRERRMRGRSPWRISAAHTS